MKTFAELEREYLEMNRRTMRVPILGLLAAAWIAFMLCCGDLVCTAIQEYGDQEAPTTEGRDTPPDQHSW